MRTRLNNEIPRAQDAIAAVKAKIQSDVTILGVAGTIGPTEITIAGMGLTAFEDYALSLSGANIGKVTLTNCFTETPGSFMFDLSDNRMQAGSSGEGLQGLLEQLSLLFSSGGMALNIVGNAIPNATTIAIIEALVLEGNTISYEGL